MPGVTLPPNKAGDRMGPAWIPQLLDGSYFVPCHHHAAAHKSERNFFCADCGGESLCHLCVQKQHAGHTTMQIRRSSYHEVVRVSDVQRLLDTAHIQVYVINSAKIVFLNGRPQAKPVKGAPYACETCHRTLLDACRFCSIGCKLVAVPEDPSLNLQPRVQSGGAAMGLADAMEESGESGPRRVSNYRSKRTVPPLLLDVQDNSEDDSLGDSDGHDSVYRRKRRRTKGKGRLDVPPLEATSSLENSFLPPGTPPQSAAVESPWKLHRRKSVPHRAPMW